MLWESGCSLRAGGFLEVVSLRRIFIYLLLIAGYPHVHTLSDAAAKVVHEWLFVQIFFGWNGGVLDGMVVFGLYWGL